MSLIQSQPTYILIDGQKIQWKNDLTGVIEERIKSINADLEFLCGVGGVIKVDSNRITNLATPVDANDAATKEYVNNFTILVDDYGAVGDGTTDDTAAFIAAFTTLGNTGGTIHLHRTKKYLIDSNLTIPAGCAIVGNVQFPGTLGSNTNTPYGNYGSVLIINSTVKITLLSSASISKTVIYRKGMTFPATDSSAFAGTAIYTTSDDAHVANCMILGFNKAFDDNGGQRPRCENVYIDCNNGIFINDCWDITYLDNCHCWPYATIKTYKDGGSSDDTILERSGIGFSLTNVADWAKITNCFAYAYLKDFYCNDVNSVTMLGCGADSTPTRVGRNSYGFSIAGTSAEIRMLGCQAGAQLYGVHVNVTSVHVPTFVENCSIWSCNNGVYQNNGDVNVIGGTVRDCSVGIHNIADDLTVVGTIMRGTNGGTDMTNAVYIDGVNSHVLVDNVQFHNVNGSGIVNNSGTNYLRVGNNTYDGMAYKAVHQTTDPDITLASAPAITLESNATLIRITGTTNINEIYGGWYGRIVTLRFSDVLTIVDSTNINLNGNYVTALDETLTLIGIGNGEWYEITRSATSVDTHATTHVTGGGDTIANAIAAGNSGLMSGADKTKLNGIDTGAKDDQTASEIMALLNASAQILDDNNIASSITRDSELSAHAGSASAHHSSISNGLNITPAKINCADIRNPSGSAMAFKTFAGDTHFYTGDDTNGVTFARHVRPYSDNAYVMGDASHRWSLVRGVTVTSGDLGFEETTCPKCGKSFEIGDTLILVVKTLHEYGTLTIPMHLKCVDLPPVEISLPVPQMRDEWRIDGELLKTIRVPDTEMKTKTILKIRPNVKLVKGKTITHIPILNTRTGEFKLKGKTIAKNQATQLVDETVEVPIYKDVNITI